MHAIFLTYPKDCCVLHHLLHSSFFLSFSLLFFIYFSLQSMAYFVYVWEETIDVELYKIQLHVGLVYMCDHSSPSNVCIIENILHSLALLFNLVF